MLAEKVYIITFRDFWLVENGMVNAIIKTHMKKAVDVKKKVHKKLNQTKEKTRSKERGLRKRKLVLANYWAKFGFFKAVLSDLPTGNDFLSSIFSHIIPSSHTSFLPVL